MDVAKAAGVSFSTVALAFRNPQRVSATTREKINAAATQLGYERNPLASALASRTWRPSQISRSGSIAYVTCLSMHSNEDENHSDSFIGHLEQECERMGYGIEFIDLRKVRDLSGLTRRLQSRGCVGIVFGPLMDPRLARQVDWSPFSLIHCNNDPSNLPVHRVESDVFEAAWRTSVAAIQRGYRHIGLSLFRHAGGFDDDLRREGAFRMAIKETRPALARPLQIFSHDGAWNEDKFMRWFEKHSFDSLICFGMMEYLWLKGRGMKIPGDLSMATLTCAGESEWLKPLTGCREDFEQIVVTAFRMCEQFIRAREHGFVETPQSVNVPCIWHEGSTLPFFEK
jgi:LacI family transcriptional regulator